MKSLYDIAFDFLDKYYSIEPSAEIKISTLKQFSYLLNCGVTSEEIYKMFDSIPANGSYIPDIATIFLGHKVENVLVQGDFYYHNLLRCAPPPPTQIWDINTGSIQTISEPYYLEMRASITLGQVVEYYCSQLKINLNYSDINRYKGSFKYMIEKHGIDLVLFMIDATRDMVISEHHLVPTSPVGINENIHLAEERLNQKKNENKSTGDDKIVAKRRIFTNRSGSQTPERNVHQEHYNYNQGY